MVLNLIEKNYMMVLDPPEMINLLPLVGSYFKAGKRFKKVEMMK